MLPFGRLLSQSLATISGAQVGNAGDPIIRPGTRGAQSGDFAFWILTTPPSSAWTNLSSSPFPVYTKSLTASDLNLNASPSQPWALLIYRDVTSAILGPEAGFVKAAAHMGVVALSYKGATGPQLATPPDTQRRVLQGNAPTLAGYDITAPLGPYPDGTAFTPGAGSWTIIELLRS